MSERKKVSDRKRVSERKEVRDGGRGYRKERRWIFKIYTEMKNSVCYITKKKNINNSAELMYSVFITKYRKLFKKITKYVVSIFYI